LYHVKWLLTLEEWELYDRYRERRRDYVDKQREKRIVTSGQPHNFEIWELHRKAALEASGRGISLNALVEDALIQFVNQR
jgi:predicted HicB family RNase H-like nuclease